MQKKHKSTFLSGRLVMHAQYVTFSLSRHPPPFDYVYCPEINLFVHPSVLSNPMLFNYYKYKFSTRN